MHETGRKAKIERLTIEGKTVDSNNLTKFNLTENLTITYPNVCLRLLFFLFQSIEAISTQAQKCNLIA